MIKNSVLSSLPPPHKKKPKVKKIKPDDGLGDGWFGTLYRLNKSNRRKKITPDYKNPGGKVSKSYASCGANIITGRD